MDGYTDELELTLPMYLSGWVWGEEGLDTGGSRSYLRRSATA